MMRNLLRFDLTVSSGGATVVGLNMDEISSIADVVGSPGTTAVTMTDGSEWLVVGSPESTMDLIANITDELEGRAL
jgi:hypothetical protein